MIVKSDVTIAKNYLNENELRFLNRMVTMYLDYAESMAERYIPMSMEDWANKLDGFIEFISAEQARLYAHIEFEKYRIVQDRLFESDFDRFIKNLESKENE